MHFLNILTDLVCGLLLVLSFSAIGEILFVEVVVTVGLIEFLWCEWII